MPYDYRSSVNDMSRMPSLGEIIANVKRNRAANAPAKKEPMPMGTGEVPNDVAGGPREVQIEGEAPIQALPVTGEQDPRKQRLRQLQQSGLSFGEALQRIGIEQQQPGGPMVARR